MLIKPFEHKILSRVSETQTIYTIVFLFKTLHEFHISSIFLETNQTIFNLASQVIIW